MIVITTPGFGLHGGIRILMEWANRLSEHYPVTVLSTTKNAGRPAWFKLKDSVTVTENKRYAATCEILIIGSPHGIDLQDTARGKVFIFLQMMEHLFRPGDKSWLRQCMKFYKSPHTMILGSNWNYIWCREFGRTAPTYYVGNGVNIEDFPIYVGPKEELTVLLESPVSSNAAKDVDSIALNVAAALKTEGYNIIGYGAHAYKGTIIDEYHVAPSLARMNYLYERATILIKATKYDARALAPMEAMTKGCVTARAIEYGDDDLLHEVNALRCGYNYDELYRNSKRLLQDHELRKQLSENCLDYVQKFSWDFWMKHIVSILNGNPLNEVRKML